MGDATSATYTINGGSAVPITPVSGAITIPGFSTDNTYTVIVTATDATGNTATAPAFTFTVDKTPPVIIVTPTPVPDASGSITVQVGDATSATYTINGGAAVPVTPVSGAITIPGFSTDNTYTVIVTATDAAGNTATAPAFTFTVDKTPPVITPPSANHP